MIWLFASVVLVLMVFVKAFRKFVLVTAAVLFAFGGITALYVNARDHADADARNAAYNVKPLCGGKDPAQTALDSGGKCRPF